MCDYASKDNKCNSVYIFIVHIALCRIYNLHINLKIHTQYQTNNITSHNWQSNNNNNNTAETIFNKTIITTI